MDDVAIIGVGLHPFGRHGDKSAYEMAADAVELALADAGVTWNDVPVRLRRELGGLDRPPHRLLVGLTRPSVHPRVQRMRNRRGHHPAGRKRHSWPATVTSWWPSERTSTLGARSKDDPTTTNVPAWYGENGQYVTTKFFGMKINKYMHDHGVSQATLAKVAAKNYRNGALNPKAFRRKPITEEEILSSPMLNYPLTSYMFCAPDEGAAAVVLCRADIAHRYTDTPVYVKATAIRTRNYGSYEVKHHLVPRRGRRCPHRVRVPRRLRRGRDRARGR